MRNTTADSADPRHEPDASQDTLLLPAFLLAFAASLISFDVTALAVALSAIGAELGFGVVGMAWVMDAYSLAFAGLLLAAGAFADRHGRRRVLLAGNWLFLLASLGCGLAWTGPLLWAARAAQGVGAAMVVTGSLALLSDRYPAQPSRARAFALVGVVSGVAMAFGPTLGGVITQWAGWRWIFLANLPACLLLAWAVPRVLPESRDPHRRPLDWPGVTLLTLGLGASVAALLVGGTLRWPGLAVGIGLLAGFAAQQRARTRPMLDPALFGQPAVAGICAVLLALSVGYWAPLVYLPLYLEATLGLPSDMAGMAMLVATLPMLALPPLGAWLAPRLGWRRFFGLGLMGVAAGDLLLAASAQLGPVLAGMLLAGCGAGMVNAQVSGAMVALAPRAQAGMASAVATVMRQGGFAVGIAAFGGVLEAGRGTGGFWFAFLGAGAVTGLVAIGALAARKA